MEGSKHVLVQMRQVFAWAYKPPGPANVDPIQTIPVMGSYFPF